MNPEADVADVVVLLEDGSRYRGTVTTPQFIKETMQSAKTADSTDVEGDYWFSDAIIMQRIDETKLEMIVADLIDSFMFEKAFNRAWVSSSVRPAPIAILWVSSGVSRSSGSWASESSTIIAPACCAILTT